MRSRIQLITVSAAVALALGAPAVQAAITCFPAGPVDGSTNVARNIATRGSEPEDGLKGIDLFCNTDAPPVSIGGTTAASLSFAGGGSPPACVAGELSPDPGQCGFVTVDLDMNGNDETLRIFVGGFLPASETVTVDVQNVEDAVAATDSESWSFSTSAATPRAPVAVELVFDISGSMGWPAVPGGAIDRITALQSAAQAFFNLLGSYAVSGDALGVVYFSTTASVFAPASPIVGNLAAADDSAAVSAIQMDVNNQMPTNATSIGDGLDDADSPQGFHTTPNNRYVLLFSDGEQNTDPEVTFAGGQMRVGGVAYDAGITVCPITAGRQTAPGFSLQQQIATSRCDGHNAHIRDTAETFVAADLETFFLQDLSDILVGDKLELVRDVTGGLSRDEVVEETFLANPGDLSLSVLLSWSAPTRVGGVLLFDLVAPDGTVVSPGSRTRFGSDMSFTTLRLPAVAGGAVVPTAGEWRLRIRGSDLSVPSLDYHLVVLLDNTSLVSEFEVAADDPGTGEAVPIEVTLTEAGAPVLNAAVTARLLGPEEGLGDILSQAPAGSAPADDPRNPVAQGKLFTLLNDPASAALLADADLGILVLADDGSAASGDAVAGDGVYTGLFGDTDEEGHYHFAVNVAASAPDNGDYQRTRRVSVFVRPKPDPAETVLAVVDSSQTDDALRVTLHATPRDSFRNLLGPGYLGSLDITVDGATVVQPLEDLGNGTYGVTYSVLPGDDPEVTLEVLGEDVEGGSLSELPGSPLAGQRRWSLHLGYTDPHGILSTVADGSWSLGLDLRDPVTSWLTVELFLGHDRFDSKVGGDDPYLTLLTGRTRFTLGGGAVRPSLFLGAGPFVDRDGDLFFGWEAGAALEVPVGPALGLELSYAHRNVDARVDYGVVHLGLLFDF